MKKIAKYFFAALAVASAVSCAKELTDDFRPADKVQQGKSYTFTATMADTKSVIDEETLEILWSGDENNMEYITVLEPAATGITAKAITYSAEVNKYEPTSVANFSQHNEEAAGVEGNTVFAVYPAGDWKSFSNADSLGVAVTFATEQNAVAGTYDPKAPVAVAYNNNVAENQDLHFQNTSALLKLQLAPTTGTVNTITVYSLGGETLAGEILLMNKGGVPSMVPVKETAKSYVNLNFKEYEAGATYYIAVAPATLSKGIALQFNGDEVQTYTISDEIVIERGMVYDLGVFACNEPEDAWYLIGDYNVGNANTIKKTELVEVEGKDFLVAKDVTIRELQGFKVYNPATRVSYYPEVNDLDVNEWFPLTKGEGYGYASSSYNVYDVYVECVDSVMTNISLADAGYDIPAFNYPDGLQYSCQYSYSSTEKVTYVVDLSSDGSGAFVYGYNYDEYMPDEELADPSLKGKWAVSKEFAAYEVNPTNNLEGTITFREDIIYEGEEEGFSKYYMIQYSNYSDTSIVLYSPYAYFFDENDNPVVVEGTEEDWYQGINLTNGEPAEWAVSEEIVEFSYPVPTGMLWDMTTIIDFGTIYENKFTYGSLVQPEISADEEEFYNFFGVTGDYCAVDFSGEIISIIPESNTSGVFYAKIKKDYYKFNYSNYSFEYGQPMSIAISSSSEIEKEPVLDANGEHMEGGWPSAPLYCNGIDFELAEAWTSWFENGTPRFIAYDVPESMPVQNVANTPVGKQYIYEETYEGEVVSTKLFDFGYTKQDTILVAQKYDEMMGLNWYTEEEIQAMIEAGYVDTTYLGQWVYQESYADFDFICTSEDSGIITFEQIIYDYWDPTEVIGKSYSRIDYSELTETSVCIYSESNMFDKFNEYMYVYDVETGEMVMTEEGNPYTWTGLGYCDYDESYQAFPAMIKINEEPVKLIEFVQAGGGIM